MDATMAGMSMEELAQRMLEASPAVRIIAASGYPVNLASLLARHPQRVLFLQKPFSPEALVSAVRRMLGQEKENI